MVGLINKEDIYDIADAIREKTQTEDTFKPSEMGNLIRSIRVIPENSYQLKEIESTPTSLATFDADALPMPSLKVGIEPVQDLHGYDYPWVGGAGKNKLQVTGTSQTINGVTFTVNDDGSIIVNGTATADVRFVIGEYILKADSSVRLNGSPVDGSTSTIALGYQGYGIVSTANSDRVCNRTSQSTDWVNDVYINVTSGYTANNLIFKPMIRLASDSDSIFAPYSNICPISGHTEANVVVSPTTDAEDGTTYTIQFTDAQGNPIEVFGGTLDVVSGVLTVDRGILTLNGSENYYTIQSSSADDNTVLRAVTGQACKQNENQKSNYGTFDNDAWQPLESRANTFVLGSEGNLYLQLPSNTASTVEEFKALFASNNLQVVYELTTPTTIQLTPTQVNSLLGTTNIWADTGDVGDVRYFKKVEL